MNVNKNVTSVLTIVCSICTIILGVLYFLHYTDIDIMMLFLGFTQLFGGLNQINLAKQINTEGMNKSSKAVGVFSTVLGIVITSAVLIKMVIGSY